MKLRKAKRIDEPVIVAGVMNPIEFPREQRPKYRPINQLEESLNNFGELLLLCQTHSFVRISEAPVTPQIHIHPS
jgi:hypothetical protein